MPHKKPPHNSVKVLRKNALAQCGEAQRIRKTNRWKRMSENVRDRFPLCQWPDGCEELSTSVHHIEPIARRPELAYSESNLVPLCEHHHDWCNDQEAYGHATAWKFKDWIEKMEDRYNNYFGQDDEEESS